MVRLDPASIKFKEQAARFSNNLLSVVQERIFFDENLNRYGSWFIQKGIRVCPEERTDEFVCLCVLRGVKTKSLI